MKNTTKYALFGAVLALITPALTAAPDCQKIAIVVKKAVTAQPDKVLELVATQVAQNESCACEIVKAAIIASKADEALVAYIVNSAINAAPSKARVIGQCAVAVAPDALAGVQAIVAKAVASNGQGNQNPLDFPDGGKSGNPIGPVKGGPGGEPLLPRSDILPVPLPNPSSATPESR